MDIRQLEYFAEVAKHLNFTKAAAELHVSQPSLSKTIKNMEASLGVPLFYRSFRQLELTDAGAALLQNAKQVLYAYQHLTSAMDDVMNIQKGAIRIGIPPIVGAAFCADLISHYYAAFPQIDLSLQEVGSKMIMDGILDGEIDVGFVCHPPKNNQAMTSVQLLKDPLMVLMHTDNPLCQKEGIELKELEAEAFVMYRQDFSLFNQIMDACTEADFYPEIVCQSSQKDFMMEMVAAKLGIALLPQQICEQIHHKDLTAVPLVTSTVALDLHLVWKQDHYVPFAVRAFISLAKNKEAILR